MRAIMATVYAVLIMTLLAVPSAKADSYFGCRTGYCQNSYGTNYSHGCYQNGYGYEILRPYAIPVVILPDTFYRVDSGLVQGRLIQVASEDAANKTAEKFLAMLTQMQQQPQVPHPPAASAGATPNAAKAPANTGTAPNQQHASAAEAAKAGIGASNCLVCHGGSDQARMNLSDLGKLSSAQLFDVEHRAASEDPEVQMPPPSKKAGEARQALTDYTIGAIHAMGNAALKREKTAKATK